MTFSIGCLRHESGTYGSAASTAQICGPWLVNMARCAFFGSRFELKSRRQIFFADGLQYSARFRGRQCGDSGASASVCVLRGLLKYVQSWPDLLVQFLQILIFLSSLSFATIAMTVASARQTIVEFKLIVTALWVEMPRGCSRWRWSLSQILANDLCKFWQKTTNLQIFPELLRALCPLRSPPPSLIHERHVTLQCSQTESFLVCRGGFCLQINIRLPWLPALSFVIFGSFGPNSFFFFLMWKSQDIWFCFCKMFVCVGTNFRSPDLKGTWLIPQILDLRGGLSSFVASSSS